MLPGHIRTIKNKHGKRRNNQNHKHKWQNTKEREWDTYTTKEKHISRCITTTRYLISLRRLN